MGFINKKAGDKDELDKEKVASPFERKETGNEGDGNEEILDEEKEVVSDKVAKVPDKDNQEVLDEIQKNLKELKNLKDSLKKKNIID